MYAEDGGSWPHLGPIVTELADRGHELSYLTSSTSDPIFDRGIVGVHPFAIGEGFRRALLFQNLDARVVVATVPQLGLPVLPRSRNAVQNGTKYLYVFHSMASTHMIYEADGFDHYDVVLCVGPYMVDEIRRREALHQLPTKELIPHGYARLDSLRGAATEPEDREGPPVVLVAPSWGPTCLFETCGADLVEALLDAGFEVVARPHPMTAKRSPEALPRLLERVGGRARFRLDDQVAGQASLLQADVMVSDWSGAALEFAFGLERPVLFIDVGRKVNNQNYEELGIEPFEVTVRPLLGAVLAPDRLAEAPSVVEQLLADRDRLRVDIARLRDESIYNIGRSAAVAADAIEAALGVAASTIPSSGRGSRAHPGEAQDNVKDTGEKGLHVSLDHRQLFVDLAARQPVSDTTSAAISVPATVKRWLEDGPSRFEGEDRRLLDQLCRQIDVRKRVSTHYGAQLAKVDPEVPAPAVVVSGLVAVLLANADQVDGPGEEGEINDGWALKCVNSALKALVLRDDLPGSPGLRAWALEVLDRVNRPGGGAS